MICCRDSRETRGDGLLVKMVMAALAVLVVIVIMTMLTIIIMMMMKMDCWQRTCYWSKL